jgi:hypothetical protein
MAITYSFIHHLILQESLPGALGMPSGYLYPSADSDMFDPRHLAFVPDVIPSLRLHYYRSHVVVLVPYFSILLGSSLALRKEMMTLERLIIVLCVQNVASS